MADILIKPTLDIKINFTVNESEARALDALAGYGDDAFIKAFYTTMGQVYLNPHEKGLRSFLTSIRHVLNPALGKLNEAREVFNKIKD